MSSDKYDNLWIEKMTSGTGTYGCSFSSGPSGIEDDLTYWRLYGNNGNGCSFKISRSFNEHIYKVRYRDRNESDKKEDEEVAERLNKLIAVCQEAVNAAPKEYRYIVGGTAAELLFRIIHSYFHLIKHVAYENEREWRMINVLPQPSAVRFDTTSGNVIKRYVEGATLEKMLSSGSLITVGPTVPNHGAARAYIEYLA